MRQRRTVDGLDTFLVQGGEGPLVVLLHGVPSSWRLWESTLPALVAAGYRVLAPDIPGYGQSEDPDDPGLEAMVRWARALLELSGPPFAVVGQDYGGLLAVELACERRCERIVLTSTAVGPGWMDARVTAHWPLELVFYRLFGGRRYLVRGVHPDHRQRFVDTHAHRLGPAMVDRMRQTGRSFALPAMFARPGRLRASGATVRLVWGSDDAFFPPRVARAIARGHGSPIAWVEGGRHYVPAGRPELYNFKLLDVLSNLGK